MSKVDLSALRLDPQPLPRAGRPLAPRLLLGTFVLLALAVLATFLWPLLRPTRVVPMTAVRAGEASAAPSSAAAEAVGWVEADPFPTLVRPLVNGRIENITVLEGASVVGGETVIAQLANTDLQIEHEVAQAKVLLAQRALGVANAELQLAQARLRQNAAARTEELEAQGMLRAAEARLAKARGEAARTAAMAREAAATASAHDRLREAGGSNDVARERAQAALLAAQAEQTAAAAELAAMEGELVAARARAELAAELRQKPVDLEGAVQVATQAVERAHAERHVAEVELAMAARKLELLKVAAPVSGVVMRLPAAPGDTAGPDMPPILAIYEPRFLRARIDVPLGSVAGVHPGQQVELRSESLGNTVVRGVVQRIQHESDLLKNTLQVKVGIQDAPPLLRPETLVRASFLAEATNETAATTSTFRVPKAAVQDGSVFVFDPVAHRARAVAVEIVGERGDEVLVRGELSVTQKVVLAAVQDGERVEEQR